MRRFLFLMVTLVVVGPSLLAAPPKAPPPTENDYYRMVSFPLPPDVVLEVGGMDFLDKAKTKLLVCTRRGEVWRVENVYADEPVLEGKTVRKKGPDGKEVETAADPKNIVRYHQMLFGLHEPLGLLTREDGVYVAQRGELTRLKDTKNSGRFDLVENVCNDWETSGGYHEFAFGPKEDRDGNLWVTLNRPFGEGPEGRGHWRGWAVKIDKKGKMQPVCPGLRSPCGLGTNAAGDMFYTDNQGDWTAACKLSHLKPGLFQGEAFALTSIDHPKSTMKNPGKGFPKQNLLWPEAVKEMPQLVAPAVWFPYPVMGQSHSDVLCDTMGGKFGPFQNQLFVGDQTRAFIVRCFLEKVDGEYQGACFPFRKGFQSGVLRMCYGNDGSMFVGGTNRGWGGGARPYNLERIVWTGKTPFEIHEMRATPTGFQLNFTHPVDAESATNLKSYAMSCWTYRYHAGYGDPPREMHDLTIKEARVSEDGKTVTLTVEKCEPYYIHWLKLPGVRNRDAQPLLHTDAYYTLNRIPKAGK
jgi:hypothetical protein